MSIIHRHKWLAWGWEGCHGAWGGGKVELWGEESRNGGGESCGWRPWRPCWHLLLLIRHPHATTLHCHLDEFQALLYFWDKMTRSELCPHLGPARTGVLRITSSATLHQWRCNQALLCLPSWGCSCLTTLMYHVPCAGYTVATHPVYLPGYCKYKPELVEWQLLLTSVYLGINQP
ncbi:hypothetical protein E2C01_010495 [Portunus trituberculatus]|uniref:Uncharacterized protein n=1 Tax=Portunus trituberculatus TaxID=210409 RepID=A0A5B7D8U6_PORTR|nr:hypothetical protein [Portunus trituberculatus]